jgi:hypothetical protein
MGRVSSDGASTDRLRTVRAAAKRILAKKAPDLPDDVRDDIVDRATSVRAAWDMAKAYFRTRKRRATKLNAEGAAALERQLASDPMAAVEARLDAAKLQAAGVTVRRRPRVGVHYGDLDELRAAVFRYCVAQYEKRAGRPWIESVHGIAFDFTRRIEGRPAAVAERKREDRKRRRRKGPQPAPDPKVNDPADPAGRMAFFRYRVYPDYSELEPRELAELTLVAGFWPGTVTLASVKKKPASVLQVLREEERYVRATLAAEDRRVRKLERDPALQRLAADLVAQLKILVASRQK